MTDLKGTDATCLQHRVESLELELASLNQKNMKKRPRRFWFVLGILLTSVMTVAAIGATGAESTLDCPEIADGLFCFRGNTPAKAVQVNHNFQQVKMWMEDKVGLVTNPNEVLTEELNVTTSLTIPVGSIDTTDILDETISSSDIQDGTITSADLGPSAITMTGETTTPVGGETTIDLGEGNTTANCFCALTYTYGSSNADAGCQINQEDNSYVVRATVNSGHASQCKARCMCW